MLIFEPIRYSLQFSFRHFRDESGSVETSTPKTAPVIGGRSIKSRARHGHKKEQSQTSRELDGTFADLVQMQKERAKKIDRSYCTQK